MIIFIVLISSFAALKAEDNELYKLKIKIELPDTLLYKDFILSYFCEDSIFGGFSNNKLEKYNGKVFNLDTIIILNSCIHILNSLTIRFRADGYLNDGFGYNFINLEVISLKEEKMFYFEKILKFEDYTKTPILWDSFEKE